MKQEVMWFETEFVAKMRPETGAMTAVCHRQIVKINQSSTIRSCVIVKRRHSHQQTDNQHGYTDNQHDQLSANTHHLCCVALSWKIYLLPAVSCTCLQRDGAPTTLFCVQILTIACPKVPFFPPFVQHNVPQSCGCCFVCACVELTADCGSH